MIGWVIGCKIGCDHSNSELKVRYSSYGLNNELLVCYSNGCITLDCLVLKQKFYVNIKWSSLNDRLGDRLPIKLRPFE